MRKRSRRNRVKSSSRRFSLPHRSIVEPLEGRRLLTVVFNLQFGAESLQSSDTSKMIQTPPVLHVVLWGSNWGTGAGQFNPSTPENIATAILNSTYLGGLTEYGINSANLNSTVDYYVDSASNPPSNFAPGNLNDGHSLGEAQTELTNMVNQGHIPGPGNPSDLEHAPIYVVIPDPINSNGNGGFNTSGTVAGKSVNIFSVGTDSNFNNFPDTFSHETAERLSDIQSGGVELNLPNNPNLPSKPIGAPNSRVQVADGEAEPNGQSHETYRIGGPTSLAMVQPFYSNSFSAFIAPDGNSEQFDLAPIWTIDNTNANNDSFTDTYNLTVNGDQLANKNDNFVISRDSAGGTEVSLNGQVAWFDPATAGFQGTPLNAITVNGLTGNDSITIDYSNGNPIPTGGLTVNGGTGANNLTATGRSNTWSITGTNSGTLNGNVTFSNIENLTGGSSNDRFQFSSGGSISGNIDGGIGGTDTLDYSALAGPITVNLQSDSAPGIGGTFSDINSVVGSAGADTLIGPDSGPTWQINAANAGAVFGVSFSSFENLTGGAGNDTFAFKPGGSISGNIDGGGGTNTLDYSALAGPITLNLQTSGAPDVGGTIADITNFVGSAGSDLLIGPAGPSTYRLTGLNSGSVGGDTFSSFENLKGGPGNDTFAFQGGGVSGNIDGDGGANTFDYSGVAGPVSVNLTNHTATGVGGTFSNISNFVGSPSTADTFTGPTGNNTWSISGTNSGSVAGNTFSSFENLTGGTGNDTFAFQPGGSVSGNIDGGAGTNTLDYSALAGPVTVNLQTRTASEIGGTFANISNFVGSAGSDTMIGPDVNTQWNITGANGGTVGADTFSSFENLIGGAGNDTFSIYDGGSLSGKIDGGGGTNTLDYSHFSGSVIVNLALNTATGVAGGVFNIEGIIGGSGNNLFIGNGANNLFVGGSGRNILIGGGGADTLIGGAGDSILIGDSTIYDTNPTALNAIFAEWTRTDLSFEQRIADLISPGNNPRSLNGIYTLDKSSILSDSTGDTLVSGAGLTWAFVNKKQDTFTGKKPRDHVTVL